MHKYIEGFIRVIRNCGMENSYKMAWAKSLVEHSVCHPTKKIIHFDELSPLIFKYYWNQTIFFQLEQGPNPHKRPKIHQIVKDKIDQYQLSHDHRPIFFTRVEDSIEIPVSQISTVLKSDVSWRFQKIGAEEYGIYELNRAARTLTLYRPDLLNKYHAVLFELINYRWSQKLEDFNTAPRIAQKVRGVDREKIKKKSLTPFRKYLDLENPERKSFLTGRPIPEGQLSIDHVIPWSYMYSDDVWNLVYVTKSENSSMSNRMPSEELIEKLENRNNQLLSILDKTGTKSKHVEGLRLAVEKDFVRKFHVGFKG